MFNISSTPFYFFDNELGIVQSYENSAKRSLEDGLKLVPVAIQKTNERAKKRFVPKEFSNSSENPNSEAEKQILKNNKIKIFGTTDHWISLYDLGSQSKVFKRMLSRNWKESATRELNIESGENREAIEHFILCLETRNSQCMNKENFQELLSLACKYEVLWLMQDCESFIAINLTLDNVLSVIKDIAVPYSRSNLLLYCFLYLSCNKDSLNEDYMKEIQTLGEELGFAELKILANQSLKPYISNQSSGLGIFMREEDFALNVNLLIQIFSENSINKPSVSLTICSLSHFSPLEKFLKHNPKLVNLHVGGLEIGSAGATHIAAALKENKMVTSLELRWNQIGIIGAIEIGSALKGNKVLRSLDLKGNSVKDAGTFQIGEALKENNTLTTLGLGHNIIGEKGAIQIAAALKKNKTLTSLDLEDNEIGEKGATQIAAALKENNTLTTLGLGYNVIGERGAIQIAAALKENKTLTSLDLQGNQIGENEAQIAAALKENKTLTSLDLGDNEIGDAGTFRIAEALKVNKTLTSLDLGDNEIGDAGTFRIAEALKVNKTLTSLDLGGNEIGEEGATQIATALKINKRLTSLDLGDNEIGEEGATQIATALKINKRLIMLNLDGNEKIGSTALAYKEEALIS